MGKILLVGCGGFIGSVGRYLVGGWMHRWLDTTLFPVGTLTVNMVGCFLIGLCGGLAESRQMFSVEGRLFLFIGIFGGFTTFSSFGLETLNLIRDNALLAACGNVAAQLIGGLLAVWLGLIFAKLI
jgi:CrcB protein